MFLKNITFFILAVLLIGCKKDPPPIVEESLPPATNSGKNTFGCYINDELFVAQVGFTIGGAVGLSGSFNESDKFFLLQGTREDEQENLDDIRLMVYVNNGIDTYSMDIVGEEQIGRMDFASFGGNCDRFYHDSSNPGEVVITRLDTIENVIAGTFTMTLINALCSTSVLEITEGRFDYRY